MPPSAGLNDMLTPEAEEAARVKQAEFTSAQGNPLGNPGAYGTVPIGTSGQPGTQTTAGPQEQDSNETNSPVYQGNDDYAQQNDIDAEDDGQDYEEYPAIDWQNLKGYDDSGKSTGNITKDDLKEIGQKALDLIRFGHDAKKTRDMWIEKWRDVFESKEALGIPPWPNATRLRPPDLRSAVETIAARQRESIFGSDVWIRVIPEIANDSDVAMKWENFFMSEMSPSRNNLESVYAKALLDAAVDGGKIVQDMWVRRKQKVRKRVAMNQNLMQKLRDTGHDVKGPEPGEEAAFPRVTIKAKGRKTLRTKYGAPHLFEAEEVVENHYGNRFHTIQNWYMFPATSACIEDTGICGVFYGMTLQQCKQAVVDGYFDGGQVDELIDASPTVMGDYGDSIESGTLGGLIRTDDSQGINRSASPLESKYGQYRMTDGAWWYDLDDDGIEERCWFTMECSTQTIVAFGRLPAHNNKIPFNLLNPDPAIGGGFYPYSQIEKAYELHIENSAQRRLAIDLATLASIIYIEMDRGSRNKPSDMQVKPGPNFIDTDEDGSIKALHQINPVGDTTMPTRAAVVADINKLLNVSETDQGVENDNESPVAIANMRQTGSAIRMRMQLVHILDNVTWIANQFFDYNRQYGEESQNFRVKRNGAWAEGSITLADLSIPCRVEAYCKDLTSDAALRQQFAEKIFTALAQSPFAQVDMTNLYVILSDYVKAMGFDEDLTPRIGSYDNAQQMQQQAAMQAEQQAQQQQAQGNLEQQLVQQGWTPPKATSAGGKPPVHQQVAGAIQTLGQRPQNGTTAPAGQNGQQ